MGVAKATPTRTRKNRREAEDRPASRRFFRPRSANANGAGLQREDRVRGRDPLEVGQGCPRRDREVPPDEAGRARDRVLQQRGRLDRCQRGRREALVMSAPRERATPHSAQIADPISLPIRREEPALPIALPERYRRGARLAALATRHRQQEHVAHPHAAPQQRRDERIAESCGERRAKPLCHRGPPRSHTPNNGAFQHGVVAFPHRRHHYSVWVMPRGAQ